MTDLPFESLLKSHDLTFFYNKFNKIWWLRHLRSETGAVQRTNPAAAKTEEEAQAAEKNSFVDSSDR